MASLEDQVRQKDSQIADLMRKLKQSRQVIEALQRRKIAAPGESAAVDREARAKDLISRFEEAVKLLEAKGDDDRVRLNADQSWAAESSELRAEYARALAQADARLRTGLNRMVSKRPTLRQAC